MSLVYDHGAADACVPPVLSFAQGEALPDGFCLGQGSVLCLASTTAEESEESLHVLRLTDALDGLIE